MSLPVNTQSLMSELRKTLAQVDKQIDTVKAEFEADKAAGRYLPEATVYNIKTKDGHHILVPLLCAKSDCLLAISNLQRPVAKR